MADFYLVRGNQIIAEIDTSAGDVTALPLLRDDGEAPLSLLNAEHAEALMASQGWTPHQALDALGIADLRASMLKTVFVGNDPATHSAIVGGVVAYHLINVGDYSIWQVDGQQADLLQLHARLWEMAPAATMGLLAVVQTFGSTFYPTAVRTATGMTAQQSSARRDRIAAYLESLGHTETAALRAAMDEHALMLGVATALGATEAQLWAAMVA